MGGRALRLGRVAEASVFACQSFTSDQSDRQPMRKSGRGADRCGPAEGDGRGRGCLCAISATRSDGRWFYENLHSSQAGVISRPAISRRTLASCADRCGAWRGHGSGEGGQRRANIPGPARGRVACVVFCESYSAAALPYLMYGARVVWVTAGGKRAGRQRSWAGKARHRCRPEARRSLVRTDPPAIQPNLETILSSFGVCLLPKR